MSTFGEDDFKCAMRQLAAGVTIITVCGKECGEVGAHAMTATAFMPLSMDPPMVLISVEKRNDTHAMVSQVGCFGVTLLAEEQAELSTRYAKKDPDQRYRFDDVDVFKGPNGALLFGGCAAAIEATVKESVDAGDHTMFIGEITWLKSDPCVKPLVYYGGAYQKVIPVEEMKGNRSIRRTGRAYV